MKEIRKAIRNTEAAGDGREAPRGRGAARP